MSRRAIAVLLCGGLGGGPGAQEPVALPADWGERDLEGKWVSYRLDLERQPPDPDRARRWARRLGEARELELLEWIALYEGWRHAGPVLLRLEAPATYRVALWNLGAVDSHQKDGARSVFEADPARALGWFERHPDSQRGRGGALAEQLRAQGHAAADPGDQLPPYDPRQLLLPQLDVPAVLVEFGDRRRAEPRQRYVHQTLRALAGVLVWGEPEPMHLHKMVALLDHPVLAVRDAAVATLTRLPGHLLPVELLLRRTGEGSDELRRRAVLVLSCSPHPRAFFALHRIAGEADHPGAANAVLRLGDVGDRWTAAQLRQLGSALPRHQQAQRDLLLQSILRLEPRLLREDLAAQPLLLRARLDRVAWLRSSQDPLAGDYAAVIADDLRQRLGDRRQDALQRALAVEVPDVLGSEAALLVGGERERFVRELR